MSSGSSRKKTSNTTRNPGAARYYKQSESIGMSPLPSHFNELSKSENVTVTTDPKRSRNTNEDDNDSQEGILTPHVHIRDRISVKKEVTVVWEDV